GLVQGSDGYFYGTTYFGAGAFSYGTVFRIGTNEVLTTLVSLANTNGANPKAALVQGSDGNFYGTTTYGGATATTNNPGYGTVFRMDANGVLTTLVSFHGGNGANPFAALVQGSDGNFYGTTYFGGASGYGTAFRMDASGELTTL